MNPRAKNLKPKIVFIGTSKFGLIILKKIIEKKYKPNLVITETDKPVGRKKIITPPLIKTVAQKNKIPVIQPAVLTVSSFKSLVSKHCPSLNSQDFKPDLFIVASYGQILSKEFLKIPKHGSLNVHPSLLPKYRGPSPVQAAILNGDKETGVTIILMDEKMDHGPIISKIKHQITDLKITSKDLKIKLAQKGGNLLVQIIPKWIKKEIKPEKQDKSKAIYTKTLKRKDGKINWQKPASLLEREIRAFYPWPGSYTLWEKKNKTIKIKILKAKAFNSSDKIKYPLGKVLTSPLLDLKENETAVRCGKDFLIIKKLQPEGKKEMMIQDFLRGYPDFVGAVLN